MSFSIAVAFLLSSLTSICAYSHDGLPPSTPDPRQLNSWFEESAREFSIPPSVLKAIAFAETRWTQTWRAQNEEHPGLFTIMGLREDSWFGGSLEAAATLINRTPDSLEHDIRQSIRAGAAYLAMLGNSVHLSADSVDWIPAIKRYSGIPDERDAALYANQVLTFVSQGFEAIEGHAQVQIQGTHQALPWALQDFGKNRLEDGDQPGIPFDKSPNFDANLLKPMHVIIHDTEGSFAGAVSWLKNKKARASAHYIFRSSDGYAKQLVRESDKAWHVRCWNPYSIGIEHEGWMNKPQYFTETMMRASARLVKKLSQKYGIPIDDTHIVGHNFGRSPKFKGSYLEKNAGNCNTHGDPGKFWNWPKFFGFIHSS